MRVKDVRLRCTGAGLLLAIGTCFCTAAYGGQGVWTSGGPYGPPVGSVSALAIDPTTPTTLYAGMPNRGVFKSTDSGGKWADANKGLRGLGVSALAIDPSNPATLYAGTAGVFKSTDSGDTWAAANSGLTDPYFEVLSVHALAIDPSNPATLYAGTGGHGVFRSADSGGSWAAANMGLANRVVYALAIDSTNPATLYAGTDGGGVFKSTDSGATWAGVNTGLTDPGVHALAINPANHATLYAGTGRGVFKSTDSGSTWAAANSGLTNPYFDVLSVYAIAIDPAAPTTLYVGCEGGVFKSTDSGSTWAASNGVLANTSLVLTLAIDPTNPATLYAGTYRFAYFDGGVFKSTDSANTWAAANAGLAYPYVQALAINPSIPATLYAGTRYDGFFKSTDAGGTWVAANSGLTTTLPIYALAIDPAVPSTVYFGTYSGGPVGGVFKSTDSAATWTAANTGLTNPSVLALAINPSTPTTLYAGTLGGVFKSTDSAGTWAVTNTGLTTLNVFALAIDPVTPATLYAGTYDGGVFKSTDSGATWAAAKKGLSNLSVYALAVNPMNPSMLYAGTMGGGVFRSTNSGGTWTEVNTGLTNLSVPALAINPKNPGTLYAGTIGGGVFTSTDAGSTWAPVNVGLPYLSVWAVALDQTRATTLYAGLGCCDPGSGGVWQVTSPTVGTTALLPASARFMGANGAFFTTNISFANLGASVASFTLKFLGNNQDGSSGPQHNFNLDPGKSSTYFDVLGSVFSQTSNFGAIRITSNSPTLDVVSVTSTPGFGGTFGQTLPAVLSSDLIPAGSSRSILYVREGDGFRSNLVLASSASVPTNVDVALLSPAGETLATKTYSVPPNGMTQINRVVRDMGVSGPVTGARLVLSSGAQGAAFTGFASVIDETTNDPTAILVQPASVSGAAPYVWLLPSSARSRGLNDAFYTTSVAVANVGSAPVSFTMKFLGHDQDGSSGPEHTFNLESGKSVTYFDVLGSVFNQASNFGAIRITSNSSTLNIVSVTSTPGFGGTFGLTIPVVFSGDLIPSGSSRSILYVREGDGFRSNLILASSASAATNVDVALVSPSGTTLAVKSYTVPPNGMTQINRIVRAMGVSGPVTGARLVLSSSTPNAAFTGFASVIDEATNDPFAVEAR